MRVWGLGFRVEDSCAVRAVYHRCWHHEWDRILLLRRVGV